MDERPPDPDSSSLTIILLCDGALPEQPVTVASLVVLYCVLCACLLLLTFHMRTIAGIIIWISDVMPLFRSSRCMGFGHIAKARQRLICHPLFHHLRFIALGVYCFCLLLKALLTVPSYINREYKNSNLLCLLPTSISPRSRNLTLAAM